MAGEETGGGGAVCGARLLFKFKIESDSWNLKASGPSIEDWGEIQYLISLIAALCEYYMMHGQFNS